MLVGESSDMISSKAALRATIKQRLKGLSDVAILCSSKQVLQQLAALPAFTSSRSASVYLSMAKEVQTRPILEALFAADASVYIPKVCS